MMCCAMAWLSAFFRYHVYIDAVAIYNIMVNFMENHDEQRIASDFLKAEKGSAMVLQLV